MTHRPEAGRSKPRIVDKPLAADDLEMLKIWMRATRHPPFASLPHTLPFQFNKIPLADMGAGLHHRDGTALRRD